ncbi:DNA-binding protein [Paenibacillus sp. IHB B 3084]|uniref:helix-turn-helix domain-containing protein n=1 Tax=Paenibacillus sp. IHB B 3084 TaxID=867076 RepID=UPI0007211C54|nr:helix-turn-helix domain-containing protein [Paenibacillus sp. IHB B 3084]ALP35371.1 DNA-binding protein [Paenibacillus sp. IHB B 3084]
MDSMQYIIGSNLAHIRKIRGLSLDKVAELTGVSKGMLAQIEKGKSNPTVTTLWKIANGLHVSFSTFLKEDSPQITKISREDLHPVIDEDGNYFVYPIFPYHSEKKFEVFTVSLKPGFTHQAEKHLGEESILMIRGEMYFEMQEQQHKLSAGDAVQFQVTDLHTYRNESDEDADFYVLIYYAD